MNPNSTVYVYKSSDPRIVANYVYISFIDNKLTSFWSDSIIGTFSKPYSNWSAVTVEQIIELNDGDPMELVLTFPYKEDPIAYIAEHYPELLL